LEDELELRNMVLVVLVWWATGERVCSLFWWKNVGNQASATGRAELVGEIAKCD
jgi:hypothetical protein